MATIEAALRTICINDATLGPLVGGERVSDGYAKQDTEHPYIVFNRISADGFQYMTGVSNIKNPSFQFSVFSKSPDERTEVADALVAALEGYRDEQDGFDIRRIFKESEFDDATIPDDGTQIADFVAHRDFMVWFRE